MFGAPLSHSGRISDCASSGWSLTSITRSAAVSIMPWSAVTSEGRVPALEQADKTFQRVLQLREVCGDTAAAAAVFMAKAVESGD